MNLPALPVSYEALLIVTNLWAMWFCAPCLKPEPYLPRRLVIWGCSVFCGSFAMALLNSYYWFTLRGF
jgi:hypothetical protein